jgi:hypothetical protein
MCVNGEFFKVLFRSIGLTFSFFFERKLWGKEPLTALYIKREQDPKDPKKGYKVNQQTKEKRKQRVQAES